MRAQDNYVAIYGTGAGRKIYVRKSSEKQFNTILNGHRSNYHFTTIFRTICLLNADGLRGDGINPANDIKTIKSGNVGMTYYLQNGAVCISSLVIIKQSNPPTNGLYHVSFSTDDREWLPSESVVKTFDASKQWPNGGGRTAHYAAVAGKFSNHAAAASRLPDHLIGAYQKQNLLMENSAGKDYSMFWSKKGEHESAESAESLASLMQQSTKNNLAVNWLIHGEGIHTFTNAAKILKSSPLANAQALSQNANAGRTANQNIYFSNPSSSITDDKLKKLCDDASLNFLNCNRNHRDLRRWTTLKNVGVEMTKPLSAGIAAGNLNAVGVVATSLGAGGFGKAVSSIVNSIPNGNYGMLAGGVIAGGFAVSAAMKKSKMIAAGVKCTFGKGNEQWYTDDDALTF